MVHGLGVAAPRRIVAVSSWGTPGWSDLRHWVWYWLTCTLGVKSFSGGNPFLFAHSSIFSAASF